MDNYFLERIKTAMSLTNSLAAGLSGPDLYRCLGDVASNSIGSQFWCVVGARESYTKGIEAGGWCGFSCSLTRDQTKQPDEISAALEASKHRALEAISKLQPDASAASLVYDLWEHESLHQGQLVRYFYANSIAFPNAFADRYALAQPAPATSATSR